ncbi:MAG: hypothetical protein J6M17_02370 [Ruminococcus sp.]|nr:hypothetical protein [Ruminococcus sp.]
MTTFLVVMIALVAGLMLYGLWTFVSMPAKARKAEHYTKVTLKSTRIILYCAAWLVITLANVMVRYTAMSTYEKARDELLAENAGVNTVSVSDDEDRQRAAQRAAENGQLSEYISERSRENRLDAINKKVQESKLGMAFYGMCLVCFIVMIPVSRRGYLTSECLFCGLKRYKAQDIAFIMEEGMERPLLIDRRYDKDIEISGVEDAAECMMILERYYKTKKQYNDEMGQIL